jgi:hypothetical protein
MKRRTKIHFSGLIKDLPKDEWVTVVHTRDEKGKEETYYIKSEKNKKTTTSSI